MDFLCKKRYSRTRKEQKSEFFSMHTYFPSFKTAQTPLLLLLIRIQHMSRNLAKMSNKKLCIKSRRSTKGKNLGSKMVWKKHEK